MIFPFKLRWNYVIMKQLNPSSIPILSSKIGLKTMKRVQAKQINVQVMQECYEYYNQWEMPQCDVATPPPNQSEYSNIFAYLFGRVIWSFTPASSNRGNCLRQASKNYQNCLLNGGVPKDKIDPYTVSISSGAWTNVHFQNSVGLNIEWSPIQLHRLIGCDGGVDDDGGYTQNPISKARTNDILHNESKGIILNTNTDNPAFCQCPIGASFDLYNEKCQCSGGLITQYSKTKARCCAPVDCNSPAINPDLVESNINTYKMYDCLSEKVSPLTPAGAGRCVKWIDW